MPSRPFQMRRPVWTCLPGCWDHLQHNILQPPEPSLLELSRLSPTLLCSCTGSAGTRPGSVGKWQRTNPELEEPRKLRLPKMDGRRKQSLGHFSKEVMFGQCGKV